MLVLNILIWGSYLPVEAILREDVDNLDPLAPISLSLAKIEDMVELTESIKEDIAELGGSGRDSMILCENVSF